MVKWNFNKSKEKALLDFELLLSATSSKEGNKKLSVKSKKLRKESWDDLSKMFGDNYEKMNEFLNDF